MTARSGGRRIGPNRATAWGKRLLAGGIGVLLVGNAAAFYLLGTRTEPVSVDAAVARFRARQTGRGGTEAGPGHGTASGAAGATVPIALSVSGPNAGTEGRSAGPSETAATRDTPSGGGAASPTAGGPATAAAGAPSGRGAAAGVAAGSGHPSGGTGSASTTGSAGGATGVRSMPAGVYTYATSGGESVSALGGASHTYPAQTTISINPGGCGADARWDGLQQRWDDWTLCESGTGEIALQKFTTYHDFFNQVDERTYTCDPGTDFRPPTTQPGTTFHGRCAAGSSAASDITGQVVGPETVVIAGQAVPAVHIRIDEVLTGATKGTRSSDSWYAADDDVLLQRTSTTDADTSTTFGYTHYHEDLSIKLTSLTPRQ